VTYPEDYTVDDCPAERLPTPAAIFVCSLHRFNFFLCYRAGQAVLASSSASVSPPNVCVFSRSYVSPYISQEGRGGLWRTATRYSHACSPWALQCLCPKSRARGAGGGGGNGVGARGEG